MVSETVDLILSAEADSEKKMKSAMTEAEKIVLSAEAYSDSVLQKQLDLAKTECASIEADYKRKFNDYQKKVNEKCSNEINKILKQSELKISAAADSIINSFFSCNYH